MAEVTEKLMPVKHPLSNLERFPSLTADHLRLAYRLAAPNIDLTQQFQCVECSHEQEMEVPLSADFFWSN